MGNYANNSAGMDDWCSDDVILCRDSEPLKGSRASLVSSKASDEASSLNEYGDIDAGKFTEDGSFIGDYGTDQRRKRGGEYTA